MGIRQSKKTTTTEEVVPQEVKHRPLREERSQSLRSNKISQPIPVKRQSSTPVVSLNLRRKSSLFSTRIAASNPISIPPKNASPPPEFKNDENFVFGTPPRRRIRSLSVPYKVVPLNVTSEESMVAALKTLMPTRNQTLNSYSPESLLRRLSKSNKSDQDLPSILVTPPTESASLDHLSPSQKRKCLSRSPSVLSGLKTPYFIETGESLPKSTLFAKGVLVMPNLKHLNYDRE